MTITATRLSSRCWAMARRNRATGDEPPVSAAGSAVSAMGDHRLAAIRLARRREHDPLLGRLVARDLRRDPALVHHEDPVGHRQHLWQVARDEDDREAARGELG